MANQPPRPRPLFRLPTIAQQATPVPVPAPTPPTEPRPPVARPRPLIPAIATTVPVATTGPSSSDATSLAPKAAPSPSSAPTSSISKAAPPQTSSTTNTATSTPTTRVPSPVPPPKTIEPAVQTSPQSPKPKLEQTELEQKIPMEFQDKTVVFRKTIGEEEVSNENETKEKGKSSGKTILDSLEAGMRVISIAGKNKGAFMKLIQSPPKHEVAHKNKNPKTKSDGSDSISGTDSNKEGNPKKNKSHKGKVIISSQPTSAFVNNNVQGINSSILYNCSCTHHDPGVHLALSRN